MNQEEEIMAPMSASKQLQNQNVTFGNLEFKGKLNYDATQGQNIMSCSHELKKEQQQQVL